MDKVLNMEEKIIYDINNNFRLCGIINNITDSEEIVVICNARTSSKDSRPTRKLANYLSKNNINNFRFDFVGCGESNGGYKDYTVSNMINNLNCSLNMLIEKYKYKSFILIGCSMGGRIVANVDTNKFNIKKIILWYPAIDYKRKIFNIPSRKELIAKRNGFISIENNWKLSYEYFKDERKYNTFKIIKNMKIPLLFIHGTNDPFVNYKTSEILSKNCLDSKLCLINNGDHGFHNEDNMNEALKKTLNFINNN